MSATDSTKQISPKVTAVGVSTVILSALALAAAVLDVEMFGVFGDWAPFFLVLVVGLINGASAYMKGDPLRMNYTAQQNAFELQRQREEDVPGRHEAAPADPDEWAREQWPDNRG